MYEYLNCSKFSSPRDIGLLSSSYSMPGVKGCEVGSSLDLQSGRGMSRSILSALLAAVCFAAWKIFILMSQVRFC